MYDNCLAAFAPSFLSTSRASPREVDGMTLSAKTTFADAKPASRVASALPGFAVIPPVDEAMRAAANRRLDTLTKPQGALGRLEPPHGSTKQLQ